MPSAFGIMLATHCKRTDTVDLKGPLLGYIKSTYSDREAEDAMDDLNSVQTLRAEVALASANATTPGMRETLTRYFRVLTAIENRFPISKEKGHAQLLFTWYDAFRPKNKASQLNIHFEKAAVLFNLAAVLNQSGLSCDRATPDGLQAACKLFQEAAGMFAFLREGEASKVDTPRPMDLSPEAITTMEKLMLAQAQECVYLKAVLDKKAPTTVARLAKQTAVMYEEVDRAFGSTALVTYFDKGWAAHTALKSSVYDVEALAQAAKGLHNEDKINIEVAVLREAFARVQNTKKLAKPVSNDMVESIARVQEAITTALAKAEKDNNSIYLQKVPAFSDAGVAVQGALLVKSSVPASLEGAENLFSSMVPDSAAKALSRYTDLVDGVMRTQRDALATATDTARIKLKEWELPETLEMLDPRSSPNSLAASSLPPALLTELEDVQNIGGINHLNGILAEIGELRRGVDKELAMGQQALETDAQEDGEVRAKYGDAIRFPPSATAAKPYWDRIAQYRSSMQAAGDSDVGVLKRLAEHEAAFKDLTVDAAALKMPRLQAPLVAVGPDDPAQVVAALRRDLDALQAMASERGGMEEALRDLKTKDNILPKLMACNPQGHEALFVAELKKYDTIAADIKQNADAQAALLARVEAGNRAFRTAFDINGWRAACTAAAADIRSEVSAFRELLDHCSEGLRFYLGMAEVVRRCRQECEDWSFTRRVQRDEVKMDIDRRKRHEEDETLARRMAMAGLGGGAAAGAPPPPAAAYPQPPPGAHGSAPPPPPPPPNAPPQHAYQAGFPPPPSGPAPPPPPPPAAQQYGGSYTQGSSTPPPPPPPAAGQQQGSFSSHPPQHSGYSAGPPPPPPLHNQPPPQYYQQPPPPQSHAGQWGAPPPPAPYQQQSYMQQPPPQGYPPQQQGGWAQPPPGYPYGAPPPPPQQYGGYAPQPQYQQYSGQYPGR